MRKQLEAEHISYSAKMPAWTRSKLHSILRDRAYIGEVRYGDQWYPGTQSPLVDRATFDRVQVLLGGKHYRSHELTYAGGLMACGHCGAVITGESITKKASGKVYHYYRCSKYTVAGHPRVRLTEEQMDHQVLAMFERIKLPEDLRHWFSQALLAWSKEQRTVSHNMGKDIQRQITELTIQKDRLLNLRLLNEIDASTFAAKGTELRDKLASLTLQLQAQDRCRDEQGELASRVFELSQSLKEKWLTSESQEKRHLLEIVCLNLTLKDASVDFSMRKPFDVLAKGLISPQHRGDRI